MPLTESYVTGSLGTRFNQTIYVSPSIAQYHDSFAVGSFGFVEWAATRPQPVLTFDNGRQVVTAVRKHPFRSTVSTWSISEGQFSATVYPTAGQPPNGYIISDRPPERYDLWVNGTLVDFSTANSPEATIAVTQDDIRSVRLQVSDRHDLSPLSNDTVTTFFATTDGSDDRPPTTPSVTFESHSRTNVVPNGSLGVAVSSSDRVGSVRNVTLYVATRDARGVPTTTPFENESGWQEVALSEQTDGTYTTTLDLGTYRGTLSVAARAVDDAGNAVETTATDAVVVGSRTPTARVDANTTLTSIDSPVRFDASDSYDDLSIASYRWDFDGDSSIDETTAGPTVTHQYGEPGAVRPRLTVVDSQGFEHTVRPRPVGVARSLPPRVGELDDRTRSDVRTAVRAEATRIAAQRRNGRQDVEAQSTFVARGDVNGGFEARDGSTVVADGNRVNGRTEAHNVIASDARFNSEIDADGTVTAVRGSTTARGGIETSEATRILSSVALVVRDDLKSTTLFVGRNGSVTVEGAVSVDRFVARNGSTITVRGSLDCDQAELGATTNVSVRGESACPGVP